MKTNAPWVVFMNAARCKFHSARLHGLVFNGTYYDPFPSMWLTKWRGKATAGARGADQGLDAVPTVPCD